MDLTARKVLVVVVLALVPAAHAAAQLGDQIPHASYFATVQAFYSGAYRDAEKEMRRETQRGVRTPQARWIDSICYHAMLGEVLYHEARNAEALAEFDHACQLLLAYPNWLLQVKFQQQPRPDPNRARRVAPWGRSERTFVLGQFQETQPILVGDLDAASVIQKGGVMRAPMLWRVNVVEVVRMSALAIRRRNELLGPLGPHDPISKQLSAVLAGGNLAPANHWSNAWIDLLRGLAQVGMGKLDEADMLIGRSLVIDGQFDHPLTCVGLLEQGRIAIRRGDTRRAAQLLAEAGYSAYFFENWDVLTESAMNGWLNHLATNGAGVYPPLEPIAAMAQVNRLQHISTKLRLAEAESLLWLGEVDAGANLVEDAGRRMGEMRGGMPGIHQLYLQAVVHILQGHVEPGGETLTRALAAQAGASLRNFQIARTNEMYDGRAASARVAVDFYNALLADPSPTDWMQNPLDAMAVLQMAHEAAFDRWFVAALERKDAGLALEIAERAKRRRFLATRPLGGRLLALREILEGSQAELSQEAVLERQQMLTGFPEYRTLAESGQRIFDQLRAGPIFASNPADTKALNALYDDWDKTAAQRQLMLAQLAVRRLPSAMEFPPLRTMPELQKSLGDGEALVVFHAVANDVYGFAVTKTDSHIWQLPDSRRLRSGIANFLKALGNFGANRQISAAELKSDAWRKAAQESFAAIFGEARLDFAKTTSLVIVPDDMLWYLPFEALISTAAKSDKVLLDQFPIRYGPTAALAVANPRPLRRPQHTGIVANDLKLGTEDPDHAALVQELESVVSGPLVFPEALPQPAHLIWPLLDGLIAIDDTDTEGALGDAASLLPRSRGAGKGAMNASIALPYGGPEQITVTSFATEAEQGLKGSRRGNVRTRPGDEVFQSLCGMMSSGARIVLLTRWRTSGRTNFDLVREFAKELPEAPAAEAWQRACLLAREAPLDATREPRLKRSDETGETPTADHPFFWAGYLLVDTGPRSEPPPKAEPAKDAAKPEAEKGNALPPPAKPPEAADKAPPLERAKGEPAKDDKAKEEVAKNDGINE